MTPILSLAACLALTADPEFKAYVIDGKGIKPATAAAFDNIRDGMTLKELVDVIGPGSMPALSGSGMLSWTCEDGRTLVTSHVTDPAAVLTAKGTGSGDKPWIKMRDKGNKDLTIPVKELDRKRK
jgi:hypothetical protein